MIHCLKEGLDCFDCLDWGLTGVVLSSKLVITEVDDGPQPVGLSVQHLPLVHPGVLDVRQEPRL